MNSCDAEPRRQVSDFAFLPFPRSLSSQTFSQSLLGPDGGARLEALNLAGCMEEFRSPPGLPEVCASAPGRLAVRFDDAPCFPLKGTPEMEEDPVHMTHASTYLVDAHLGVCASWCSHRGSCVCTSTCVCV